MNIETASSTGGLIARILPHLSHNESNQCPQMTAMVCNIIKVTARGFHPVQSQQKNSCATDSYYEYFNEHPLISDSNRKPI